MSREIFQAGEAKVHFLKIGTNGNDVFAQYSESAVYLSGISFEPVESTVDAIEAAIDRAELLARLGLHVDDLRQRPLPDRFGLELALIRLLLAGRPGVQFVRLNFLENFSKRNFGQGFRNDRRSFWSIMLCCIL